MSALSHPSRHGNHSGLESSAPTDDLHRGIDHWWGSCWGGATTAAELVGAMVVMSTDMISRNGNYVERRSFCSVCVCCVPSPRPARLTDATHAKNLAAAHY